MKSRITIEVDFSNSNAPVIQLLQVPDSDDVRDKLIKNFIEKLGYSSSWAKIVHVEGNHGFNRIHIYPISPDQMREEAKIMNEQIRLLDENPVKAPLNH